MNGLDSSLLVCALDPTTEEHGEALEAVLSQDGWALTPTVVHETYHTLVFKRKMRPEDAEAKLRALVSDPRTEFVNVTKTISLYSLALARKYGLGGRDSLIVGCYMHGGADSVLTRDGGLLGLRKVKFRGRRIGFQDPLD